jgi:hypothetical protein
MIMLLTPLKLSINSLKLKLLKAKELLNSSKKTLLKNKATVQMVIDNLQATLDIRLKILLELIIMLQEDQRMHHLVYMVLMHLEDLDHLNLKRSLLRVVSKTNSQLR